MIEVTAPSDDSAWGISCRCKEEKTEKFLLKIKKVKSGGLAATNEEQRIPTDSGGLSRTQCTRGTKQG